MVSVGKRLSRNARRGWGGGMKEDDAEDQKNEQSDKDKRQQSFYSNSVHFIRPICEQENSRDFLLQLQTYSWQQILLSDENIG